MRRQKEESWMSRNRSYVIVAVVAILFTIILRVAGSLLTGSSEPLPKENRSSRILTKEELDAYVEARGELRHSAPVLGNPRHNAVEAAQNRRRARQP